MFITPKLGRKSNRTRYQRAENSIIAAVTPLNPEDSYIIVMK